MKPTNSVNTQQDCYFYYYSTCTKGDLCAFRHEPAALKSETTCKYWIQGSCNNNSCNFRHMTIAVKRSTIPCYHESQPGGCKKIHCPFMHVKVNNHSEEEDIQNKEDIIFPIKKEENDEFALKLKEVISSVKNSTPLLPLDRIPSPPFKVNEPFIVSLHDDDSDAEGSPIKNHSAFRSKQDPEELRKLAEIIKIESSIVGYNYDDGFRNINDNMNCHNDVCDEVFARPHLATVNIKESKSYPSSISRTIINKQIEPDICVNVNARIVLGLQDGQHDKKNRQSKLSIKSRLGRYTPVNRASPTHEFHTKTEKSSGIQRTTLHQRLSIQKEKVGRFSNSGVQSAHFSAQCTDNDSLVSIKSRLNLKINSAPQTFNRLSKVSVPIVKREANTVNIGDLEIKSLKEIRAAKRQRPHSSIGRRPAKRNHDTFCEPSGNINTTNLRHSPIVFDLGSSFQTLNNTRQNNRSISKSPAGNIVQPHVSPLQAKHKDKSPEINNVSNNQRYKSNLNELAESLLEDELLFDDTLDYDEDIDEDILLQ